MRVACYMRVSTNDQTVGSQETKILEYCKLRGWTTPSLFVDHGISGSKTSRPAFDDMMEKIKNKEFDVLLVYKFDRLSRSMSQLISVTDLLRTLHVEFISIMENVDTLTPTGKLFFGIIASFAEFERSMIIQRINSGLDNAKKKGHKLGRKFEKLNPLDIHTIITMHNEGETTDKIAESFSISRSYVYKILKENSSGM